MHCVLSLLFLQVLLVVRLYRNDVLRLLMSSSADDSKSTLADLQANLELSQVQRLSLGILRPPLINQVSEVAQLGQLGLRLKLSLARLLSLSLSKSFAARAWQGSRERVIMAYLLACACCCLIILCPFKGLFGLQANVALRLGLRVRSCPGLHDLSCARQGVV